MQTTNTAALRAARIRLQDRRKSAWTWYQELRRRGNDGEVEWSAFQRLSRLNQELEDLDALLALQESRRASKEARSSARKGRKEPPQ